MVHMPPFAPGEWLNVDAPLTREALRGSVVLVDFWDYTCVNCIRTLPYLKTWHERYADAGLVIIGVHAPEFNFARGRKVIEEAITHFGLPYPVLLDNDYATWDHFANRAWPTKYLIDTQGYIRYTRRGEGGYQTTERAIQTLLRTRDPHVELPTLLPPLRPEDAEGAVCYKPTPELYAGYQRGALGNREGYAPNNPLAYRLPLGFDRVENAFYAEGLWRAEAEAFTFVGQQAGRIMLPYSAAGVNAVLGPSSDPVEIMLDLRPTDREPIVEIWQDDAPLSPQVAGADVTFDEEGRSVVCVDRARMFELVSNSTFETHELELLFKAHGLALFSFTFTSCVNPDA